MYVGRVLLSLFGGRFCWFCLGCRREFCGFILVDKTVILGWGDSMSDLREGGIL